MYEIFPRLVDIYFDRLLGGNILWETNIQNEWHILEKNCSVKLFMATATKIYKFLGARF